MQLHNIKPNTPRKNQKRVGRGGKRGTFSGHGTKGQKGRAGASVKPGFRGGDNRIWQLFPKLRGASKKPGNKKPHAKHKYFQLRHKKSEIINLGELNAFDGMIEPKTLVDAGIVQSSRNGVKILGVGKIEKKIQLPIGQILDWEYYCYVKRNPIIFDWKVPTTILYGSDDNITEWKEISAFAERYKASVNVLNHGEHFFHTNEQLRVFDKWMDESLL